MKIKHILTLLFALSIHQAFAQEKYFTRSGTLSFFSSTPMEDIEAKNSQTSCILNTSTGEIAVSAQMKGFEFEKALMQEHFNENYMESDEFPNAIFKGKVVNAGDIDFSGDGSYDAAIEGELTIHGVTKAVEEKGTFTISDGKIQGQSVFNVLLEDYKIKVPGAVKQQISESIEITVDVMLEEVK